MKTNLQTLKSELKRLTDVAELKKELNRLAMEIRSFDLTSALSIERRTRLEKQYRALRSTLIDLQKRLDTSFKRFSKLVRKKRAATRARKTTKVAKTAKSTKAKPRAASKAAKKKSSRSN